MEKRICPKTFLGRAKPKIYPKLKKLRKDPD